MSYSKVCLHSTATFIHCGRQKFEPDSANCLRARFCGSGYEHSVSMETRSALHTSVNTDHSAHSERYVHYDNSVSQQDTQLSQPTGRSANKSAYQQQLKQCIS